MKTKDERNERMFCSPPNMKRKVNAFLSGTLVLEYVLRRASRLSSFTQRHNIEKRVSHLAAVSIVIDSRPTIHV